MSRYCGLVWSSDRSPGRQPDRVETEHQKQDGEIFISRRDTQACTPAIACCQINTVLHHGQLRAPVCESAAFFFFLHSPITI
ncbi:hypothetical protein JOQ06_028224 [Pogonophryne albipinna]|uniref:Uncharacterized protein n=1 Tax=Pogonophryne albipinna TaxID=1090488 RepID=A0AAD6FMA0_9TELE|nr:hypothetical protein JOQ06_028224 [Pogonophryne albipinna]